MKASHFEFIIVGNRNPQNGKNADRPPFANKGPAHLRWGLCFLPLLSLLISCTTIQKSKVGSLTSSKNNIVSSKSLTERRTRDTATSSPSSASYYHAMRGLQYEEDRTLFPSEEIDRRALNEYLSALEHDSKAIFLLKKIAILHSRLGNQTEALFYAKKARSLYPTNGEALLLLGDLYMASGNAEQGLQIYRDALAIHPDLRDAYFKIAGIYADRQDLVSAEEMLRKGIEVGPPSALAYFYLGQLRVEKENLAEGLQFFEEALSLDPYFEPAHLGIAAIFERQKQPQAAISVYRHVIHRINPRNHQALTRLVQLLIRSKSFDEALVLLDRLLEGDPQNLDIALQKTLVYVEEKAYAKAIQTLLPVVESKKEDVRLHLYLATLYEENNEIEKAISAYQALLDRHPKAFDARIRLGYLYFYRLKNIDDALIQGNQAKQIDPQRVESYLFTGLVLHDSKRYDDAVTVFLEGIEKKPLLPDLHFHLGATFDKLNRFDEMVQQMEQAIDLDADHANALNYLGYTYADKGILLDKAIELINRALVVRPNDGYFIDSLAWAYYKQGRVKDAIGLLQKAVSTIPDDPIIHEHLGEVYLKDNRNELAKEAWERSLELNPENSELMLRFKDAGFGSPHIRESVQKIKSIPSASLQEALQH